MIISQDTLNSEVILDENNMIKLETTLNNYIIEEYKQEIHGSWEFVILEKEYKQINHIINEYMIKIEDLRQEHLYKHINFDNIQITLSNIQTQAYEILKYEQEEKYILQNLKILILECLKNINQSKLTKSKRESLHEQMHVEVEKLQSENTLLKLLEKRIN